MRYRPLDANGDYTVGVPFLVNSPACVGQAVLTRLKLFLGEWFVDTTDGTPWEPNSQGGSILGKIYGVGPDAYIKQRILTTPGVVAIATYTSSFVGSTRQLSVTATIDTLYGTTTVST